MGFWYRSIKREGDFRLEKLTTVVPVNGEKLWRKMGSQPKINIEKAKQGVNSITKSITFYLFSIRTFISIISIRHPIILVWNSKKIHFFQNVQKVQIGQTEVSFSGF